ncbi:MAG: major facilitator superfamily 1 [Hyphomicrobiales bacterium]|nr:major facilitator superfamily 1 [Hyphomicrobiales bacterium]
MTLATETVQPATAGAAASSAPRAATSVIFAIALCHLLNDMMQALVPAIYPILKESYALDFSQIGLITFCFQMTASVLQPVVGALTDSRPMPRSILFSMAFTAAGLALVSQASHYGVILAAVSMIGVGSAIFHPEAARIARAASGGRYGFAQSVFQVGGNAGTALGPLMAALIIVSGGQGSLLFFAAIALLNLAILWKISSWYRGHRAAQAARKVTPYSNGLSRARIGASLVILTVLLFSKNFYMSSMTSYLQFYLIETFHVSVHTAQMYLFAFLAAVAVGTFAGGPIGDRIGRKYVIWISILGVFPFTAALPYASLQMSFVLVILIGFILASAFSAIVVMGQELVPGRVGLVSGLFYGLSFGFGGIGAAVLGHVADLTSIGYVYRICAFLPLIGLLTVFLPNIRRR